MSEKKLTEEVRRSVDDARNGGGKSMDEMRKKHPRIGESKFFTKRITPTTNNN